LVCPLIGATPLADLRPLEIEAWRRQLADQGVGAFSAANAYRVLRAALNDAEAMERVGRSPMRGRGPKLPRTERQV